MKQKGRIIFSHSIGINWSEQIQGKGANWDDTKKSIDHKS